MKNTLLAIIMSLSALLGMSAQKMQRNACTISAGAEMYPKAEPIFFEPYTIFLKKPTYGLSLTYERRLSKFFALGVGGAWYYGKEKETISVLVGPESNGTGTLIGRYQRMALQLSTRVWAIERKRYAFTPGLIFMYGKTLASVIEIPSINFKERFNIDSRYGNVALLLTQQILLTRLSSERKGSYGKLNLVVSPFAIANVYTDLDWQATALPEPEVDKSIGYGINLGLQMAF